MFFFVAGLELKREFVAGDLRDPRRAALPIAAAVGGMIVPAVFYVAVVGFSGNGGTLAGWRSLSSPTSPSRGRKMQGRHSHGVAYYRCRFPQEYALANRVDHPRNVILREDLLVPHLDGWLAGLFGPASRRHAIDQLAAAQDSPEDLDPAASAAAAIVRDCDAKLARYRAAPDAGADPGVVTGWISQVQAGRATADAVLTGTRPGRTRRA